MLGGAGSMRRILRLLVRAVPRVRAFTAVDVAMAPYLTARGGAWASRGILPLLWLEYSR